MELNWSTFILEIINFMILVWILKRFLYKPVMDIIAQRRAGIEDTLSEAENLHADAESLREQYENRLHDWEREKQKGRDLLQTEIDNERTKLMQELHDSLDQEREKIHVSEQRQLQTIIEKAEETALDHGAQFASRLLKSVAGPELESRLLDLLIHELGSLSSSQLTQLRTSRVGDDSSEVHVASAFPLTSAQREQLQQVLSDITKQELSFHYEQETDLIAGLSIRIGAWILGANLRDELEIFAKLTDVT